jgi:hypothetical protein
MALPPPDLQLSRSVGMHLPRLSNPPKDHRLTTGKYESFDDLLRDLNAFAVPNG